MGFGFPRGVEAWYVTPVARPAVRSTARIMTVIARLRPGVSPQAAARELQAIRHAEQQSADPSGDWRVRLVLEQSIVGRARGGLWAVLGVSGLLLLIACINFTSLVAGHTIERRREVDVRKAIGASFNDIARQLLGEHLVLALSAVVLGSGVAAVVVPALLHLAPVGLAVVLFTFSVVAAVVFISTLVASWLVTGGERMAAAGWEGAVFWAG